MSATSHIKQPWETGAYLRITSVAYDGGQLVVEFEDGGRARVDAGELLRGRGGEPDWAAMTVDSLHVSVPTADGEVDISWLAIRLASDPAFAAHWKAMAMREQRMTGARVRELRGSRGLSMAALADRSGVPPERLEQIERGEAPSGFPTLERLLAALGYTLNDLRAREEAEPTEAVVERALA